MLCRPTDKVALPMWARNIALVEIRFMKTRAFEEKEAVSKMIDKRVEYRWQSSSAILILLRLSKYTTMLIL